MSINILKVLEFKYYVFNCFSNNIFWKSFSMKISYRLVSISNNSGEFFLFLMLIFLDLSLLFLNILYLKFLFQFFLNKYLEKIDLYKEQKLLLIFLFD